MLQTQRPKRPGVGIRFTILREEAEIMAPVIGYLESNGGEIVYRPGAFGNERDIILILSRDEMNMTSPLFHIAKGHEPAELAEVLRPGQAITINRDAIPDIQSSGASSDLARSLFSLMVSLADRSRAKAPPQTWG